MSNTARGVLIALGPCWAVWRVVTLVDASDMMTLGPSSTQPQEDAGIITSMKAPIDGSTTIVDLMELGARLTIQLAAV